MVYVVALAWWYRTVFFPRLFDLPSCFFLYRYKCSEADYGVVHAGFDSKQLKCL